MLTKLDECIFMNTITIHMRKEYRFFVYIMASISKVFYIGVTNNLFGRIDQLKRDLNDGFSKQYRCHKLVYFEEHQYIDQAISREKQLKKWRREKKESLIGADNPEWHDLALEWSVETSDFSPPRRTSLPFHARLRSK